MPSLVVRNRFSLLLRNHLIFLLHATNHAVRCPLKVHRVHGSLPLACRDQSSLVHDVRDVGAGESRRESSKPLCVLFHIHRLVLLRGVRLVVVLVLAAAAADAADAAAAVAVGRHLRVVNLRLHRQQRRQPACTFCILLLLGIAAQLFLIRRAFHRLGIPGIDRRKMQLDLVQINLEDVLASLDVRPIDRHRSVEATRTEQSRIQNVGTICSRQHDNARGGAEAVHLHEELVQRVLALVVSAHRSASTSRTSNGINLIDEYYARLVASRLCEQVAHARGTDADKHLHEI
mmetsp:Transcript_5888/g.15179  ORF Transcript_5888/g.15179 Transcript_5888/m.15179 type:complete len:289 (+) Transcript_5888:769-1635(+)